jgi:hypothetical protein
VSATRIDRDWEHLYPAFRSKLRTVLEETARRTGRQWLLVEGYRSQERQTWLYAQGRTRLGQIVTWMRTPRFHGSACAADVAPDNGRGQPDYQAPRRLWETLRQVYHAHGLDNPAWAKGDLGHIQLSDRSTVQKGAAWAKAGFPPLNEDAPGVAVLVNGKKISPSGYLDNGTPPQSWVPVRHVYIALSTEWQALWRLGAIVREGDHRAIEVLSTAVSMRWRLEQRGDTGFVPAAEWRKARVAVTWEPKTKTVRLEG